MAPTDAGLPNLPRVVDGSPHTGSARQHPQRCGCGAHVDGAVRKWPVELGLLGRREEVLDFGCRLLNTACQPAANARSGFERNCCGSNAASQRPRVASCPVETAGSTCMKTVTGASITPSLLSAWSTASSHSPWRSCQSIARRRVRPTVRRSRGTSSSVRRPARRSSPRVCDAPRGAGGCLSLIHI